MEQVGFSYFQNTEDYLFQVILEKVIRIPRSLSVRAANILKVRHVGQKRRLFNFKWPILWYSIVQISSNPVLINTDVSRRMLYPYIVMG